MNSGCDISQHTEQDKLPWHGSIHDKKKKSMGEPSNGDSGINVPAVTE